MVAGERLPPFDVEAEESVIASLLVDEEAVYKVVNIITPDDFYREQNRWCYEACLSLWERNEAINQVTVAHELSRLERLEEAGGVGFLSRLVAELPTSIGVEHYAGIVFRDAIYRRLIAVAAHITKVAYEGGPDLDGVLSRAESMVLGLREARQFRDFIKLRSLLDEFMETPGIESLGASLQGAVRTGFVELDELLGGLQRSDLIIVAARPSLGKTSLCLNIARNAAVAQSARVAIFSVEMAASQLAHRMLSSESGVDSTRLRLGAHSESEERRVMHALGLLSNCEIYIDDSSAPSVMEIKAKARRLAGERGQLDLIIIDYLQLLHANRPDNRVQEIGFISRTLKGLARELEVPVIAVSQLSRAPMQRTSHVPMLSDLRESGSIEQDADVVMFVHREAAYLRREEWAEAHPELPENAYPEDVAEIIVAKHRNGPTGTVHLRFRNNLARFEDLRSMEVAVDA